MCSSNNSFHGVPCDGSKLHHQNNQQHAAGDLADMIRAISTTGVATGGGITSTCRLRPAYSLDFSTTANCWKQIPPPSSLLDTTTFPDHWRAADQHQQEAADQLFAPFSFHGQYKQDDADNDQDKGCFFNGAPFGDDPLFQHGDDDDDQQDMIMNGSSSRNYLYCCSNSSGSSNNMNMDSHLLLPSSVAFHDQQPVSCYSQQMKQQPEEVARAKAAAGITDNNTSSYDISGRRPNCNGVFSEMLHISQNLITTRPSPSSPPNTKPESAIISTPQKQVSSSLLLDDTFNNLSVNNAGFPSGTVQLSSPRVSAPIKRRKSLAKKVVCIPAPALANSRPGGEVVPSDLWAWRKYGQKPIKGSPYPRGYYRCSSSKGCSARKQVERSRTDPNMLVITYTSEHNHAWPTQRNALAGSTRSQLASHKNSNNKAAAAPPPCPNIWRTRSLLFEPQQCALSIEEETEERTADQQMKYNNDQQTMATRFVGFSKMPSSLIARNTYVKDEESTAGNIHVDHDDPDQMMMMMMNMDDIYNEQSSATVSSSNEHMRNHQQITTMYRPLISMMHRPADCYNKVEQSSSQQDDFFAELGEIDCREGYAGLEKFG